MVKNHIVILLVLCVPFCLYTQDTINVEDSFIITSVEKPPVFDGDLLEFIKQKTLYPESALKEYLEGTVMVEFWIDSIGNTYNHKIIRGIRADLNMEALRVTKEIRYAKPATNKGKPVAVRYVVPVIFQISSYSDSIITNKKRH